MILSHLESIKYQNQLNIKKFILSSRINFKDIQTGDVYNGYQDPYYKPSSARARLTSTNTTPSNYRYMTEEEIIRNLNGIFDEEDSNINKLQLVIINHFY